jgi:hypothetical protein
VDADLVHGVFHQLQLQLRQALQQDVGECSAWLALEGPFLQVTYMLHLQQCVAAVSHGWPGQQQPAAAASSSPGAPVHLLHARRLT